MLMRYLKCVFVLALIAGLSGCAKPANEIMLKYEQTLCRADSLAQAGAMDSAQAVGQIAELHRAYNQSKEATGGKRVRVAPSDGKTQLISYSLSFLLILALIWINVMVDRHLKDKKYRRYMVRLNENENDLHSIEREMAELEACLADMPLTDEMREDIETALKSLMKRNDELRDENEGLHGRLKAFETRPLPPDLELLKAQGDRLRRLDDQVQSLSSTLVARDEVVARLHEAPRFLTDADWDYLRRLTDRVYSGFTTRLLQRFPTLTPADQQLCLLIRLRFSNAQVAAFIAVSPSSVSQQKFRLKKRLLQADADLFSRGETLDMVICGV